MNIEVARNQYPAMAVLQKRGVADVGKLMLAAGIESPVDVSVFTSTYPEQETNPYNESIQGAFQQARWVFFQQEVLYPQGTLALDMKLMGRDAASAYARFVLSAAPISPFVFNHQNEIIAHRL